MSKKLNRTSDEVAAREIQTIPTSLEKRAAMPYASLPAPNRYRHASIVASMFVSLAESKYQLDYASREIAQDLANGAQWKAECGGLVVNEKLPKTATWSLFLHDVGLVTAFGTEADRARLAGFPSEQINGSPENSSPGCEVARLWKNWLGTGVLPPDALARELYRAGADDADRWDRQWTHGIARALSAIHTRDRASLVDGLEEIAAFTEHMAWRGEWQRLGEGRLSLVGLGLCRMARNIGLAPIVKSIYIPVELLESGE